MKERSTNVYVRVLTELKNIRPDFNPLTVMTDFELASLLAFRTIFKDVQQQGCLLHLSQCLWKRLRQSRIKLLEARFQKSISRPLKSQFTMQNFLNAFFTDRVQKISKKFLYPPKYPMTF